MSLPVIDLGEVFADLPKTFNSVEDVAGPVVAAALMPGMIMLTGWAAFMGMGLKVAETMLVNPFVGPAPAEPEVTRPSAEIVPLRLVEPVAAKEPAPAAKAPVKPAAKASQPKPVEAPIAAPAKPAAKAPATIADLAMAAIEKAEADKIVAKARVQSDRASTVAKPAVAAPSRGGQKPISLPKVTMLDHDPSTVAPSVDADKPVGLAAARAGGPDDLKLISGIGPKIETILHGLGIFHFDQVAAWTPKEIAWVDQYLKFNGRITRDAWIAQADALATGGPKEYAKRFGKQPR